MYWQLKKWYGWKGFRDIDGYLRVDVADGIVNLLAYFFEYIGVLATAMYCADASRKENATPPLRTGQSLNCNGNECGMPLARLER
jgi:hypothetical protein